MLLCRIMYILTHRGLEPSNKHFFAESSFDAFKDHLERGFGIEFDLNFIKNNQIIITHDIDLAHITSNKNTKSRLCSFEELMNLIRQNSSHINALHFKGGFQKQIYIDVLLDLFKKYTNDLIDRIIFFDIKSETAKRMKSKMAGLHLAPSVAHLYDIERFNSFVGGTMISIEEAIKYKKKGLYDWVWLDEWDQTDKNGKIKKFYNRENFKKLRSIGYKIALVTPELHGTSPGLLGNENHPDAKPPKKLFGRIKEIINLNPDVICTDYPEEVLKLKSFKKKSKS